MKTLRKDEVFDSSNSGSTKLQMPHDAANIWLLVANKLVKVMLRVPRAGRR